MSLFDPIKIKTGGNNKKNPDDNNVKPNSKKTKIENRNNKAAEINEEPPSGENAGWLNKMMPKKIGITPDESPKKKKDEKPGNNIDSAEKEKLKDVFARIVTPEERNLKNFFSVKFWREKRADFIELKEKQRQDLSIYETLAMGAAPSREYYILTVLSCVIATMGLIQGSAAVIIGAMIVAPLMTPILAFSLGVVWGDLFLIKLSVVSIVKGVFWAILISASIAFLVPLQVLSQEIIARTNPSLFDIAVAIASGLVGAYGNANKKISNSLVGIAIAVALMPPLCTIGIGLGTLNFAEAGGATLLFLINLISISLAGAVVFWLMKIHPVTAEQDDVTKRAVSQIVVSVVILIVISIPVGIFMAEAYKKERALGDATATIEKEYPDIIIFNASTAEKSKGSEIDITLTGTEKPDEDRMKATVQALLERNPVLKSIDIRFFISEPSGR
jgi:uncharacterized hydrophobic protein (TIGR00271 family)